MTICLIVYACTNIINKCQCLFYKKLNALFTYGRGQGITSPTLVKTASDLINIRKNIVRVRTISESKFTKKQLPPSNWNHAWWLLMCQVKVALLSLMVCHVN